MSRPWHFGGANKGRIQGGDGLADLGCMDLAPGNGTGAEIRVTLDVSRIFQTMDGFGAAMTESSAYLIWNHPKKAEVSA